MRLSRALHKFFVLPLGERGFIFLIFQPSSGKLCPLPKQGQGSDVTRVAFSEGHRCHLMSCRTGRCAPGRAK